jgi:glutathione S-transferase
MPTGSNPYKLYGFTMSPFSMKMRTYFRYRRIPFQWISGERANHVAQTKVETYMVPVLESPDGTFKNDSTLLIDKLEDMYSERRTTPDNEADAFLAALIEDFMDEWLLWPMFAYRWRTDEDRFHNSKWIVYENFGGSASNPAFQQMSQFWADRQVTGMELLCGSFEILDDSLHRFLTITEHLFTNGMFIFGSRPSRAEIAIYGILSQLIIDPAPAALMRENFNTTYRWVTLMEDLSGVEGEWAPVSTDADRFQNARILDLLKLNGIYHLPLLAANAKALENGEKRFSFDVEGQAYTRKAHDRHAGCLEALRKRYSNLSGDSKIALHSALEASGCLNYLAPAA